MAALQINGPFARAAFACTALRRRRPTLGGSTSMAETRRWLRSYGNGSDSLASDTPVQDAIPLTNQHFRVEVQIFLSAVHRPFIAFWHPPPRSLQMIMNR
jgi:hypothetical protein